MWALNAKLCSQEKSVLDQHPCNHPWTIPREKHNDIDNEDYFSVPICWKLGALMNWQSQGARTLSEKNFKLFVCKNARTY